MDKWFWSHLNGIADNLIASGIWAGGATMAAILRSLPIPTIIAISTGTFIVVLLLIRMVLYFHLRHTVNALLTIGIFMDVPVNVTRTLYHDRSELITGYPEGTSGQDKLVYTQLSYRNIVRLVQRRGRDNIDRGYWVVTELGKAVINYLEKHPQVLDKAGSLSK